MSAPLPAYCTALLAWKSESKLTFSDIAAKLERPEVWTTALFFGQAKTDEETAKKLLDLAGTPADGLVKYFTIDDPSEKVIPAELIIKGLSGKGVDSKGVDGMITRGGTWEWPPKVIERGETSFN
jgi:cyanate lyase